MKKFGHYEVTAELGRGGMGVVYKGWDPSLNRKVAIKALGEHLLNDNDLVERFTREAKATAALNDANVIQIYYIGEEQGQPYFAMEYIEGKSLDDILKGSKSLSVKHAKNILKQACSGLAAAHKLDLVHRDIKPANLMITTDGTLKVVDFGIARTREYGDKLTNTGEFVGTPGYLSPEVCIGKDVDLRSDIFSLGIVFYEMLAGKVPFENDSPLGLMLEVVQADIPDIRELNTKVDKKTSYILKKMIAKAPEERYQNCDEIIRDLGNTIENQDLYHISKEATEVEFKTQKVNLSGQATIPSAAAITQNNMVVQQPSKSSKSKLWLVAAMLMLVVGATGFGYYNGYIPLPGTKEADKITAFADDKLLIAGNQTSNTSEPFNDSDSTNSELLAGQDTSETDKNNTQNSLSNDEKQVLAQLDESPNNSEKNVNENENMQAHLDKAPVVTESNQSNAQENSELVDSTQLKKALSNDQNLIALVDNKELKPQLNQEVTQQIQKTKVVKKPKPIVLNKGVVVLAFGDPAIANPVEKILKSQLKQQGIKVMNEQFIPGISQLLNNDLDLAALKQLIMNNGGQAMVIANVNHVGTQQLQYANRSSTLVNAQLDIDTYDIKTGDSIGNGFGTNISYTSLNATEEASDAVMQHTGELTQSLKGKI